MNEVTCDATPQLERGVAGGVEGVHGMNIIKLSFVCFFVAVASGLLGFNGTPGAAATIAKLLFWVLVLACVALYVAAVFLRRSVF